MAVSRAAAYALSRAAMAYIRRFIGRLAASKLAREFIKSQAQDLALQAFCKAAKWSAGQYMIETTRAARAIERRLNREFNDGLMGIAHMYTIGTTIVCVRAYEAELLPHQINQLMLQTIHWGENEASYEWDRRVNKVTGGKFLNVLMSLGPGEGSWVLGANFDPHQRRIEDRQRTWVLRNKPR